MNQIAQTMNPEALVAALARLFAAEGAAREVALLTYSLPEIVDAHDDNNYGDTRFYTLQLHLKINLFTQVESDREQIERMIGNKLDLFRDTSSPNQIIFARLFPAIVDDPQWRDKANAWLNGRGVSNQGRVRSDNVAPLAVDGLLFRSQQEINLYRALKSRGVSFAPLPVFVRGGETYQRMEPDFVIIHDGIIAVVEVDGDTVHTETPAEAHARTSMLEIEGVHIERISASKCNTLELANKSAEQILANLERIKSSRR